MLGLFCVSVYYILIGSCLAEAIQSATLRDLFDNPDQMKLRLTIVLIWLPVVLILIGRRIAWKTGLLTPET